MPSSVSASDSISFSRHWRGDLGHVAGNLAHHDLVALVAAVGNSLHLDQVDHAAELVLAADRHLQRDRRDAQAVANHVDHAPVVGAGTVELVDEAEARDGVLVSLPPDRLRLWLDPRHAVEHDHRAVEHAQAPLDLHGEIHVPGCVYQVDAMVVPEAGGGRGGDRDAALLLLLHPVHRRGALVHLADLVDLLGVEEDPLRDGGLPRVDVGDDADIPRSPQREVRSWRRASGDRG